jgi:hypothetical protein
LGKHLDQLTGVVSFVTREVYIQVVEIVKNQVKEAAEYLISELQSHFLAHGVIEALGVVFPQYWMMADCEEFFKRHISVIKAQHCYAKRIGPDQTWVPKVLSSMSLDLQMSFFKLTMKSNAASALGPPYTMNPMTQLWRSLSSSQMILHIRCWSM